MAPRDLVSVGVITGAHGVKGEVKLRSFTAEPSAIAGYGPLRTAAGGSVEIVRMRPQKDGFIASLRQVADRTAAEALRGTELFVARDLLPEPDDGEVYLDDLVGLAVWQKGGPRLGAVAAFANYGASDLIEVQMEGRRNTVLIPFTEAFVSAVDIAGGRLEVDLPAGYLDEGP